MTAVGPNEAVDLDGDRGEPIRGAVKVAPAPINAANTGTTTAWIDADLARLWDLRRMPGYRIYIDVPKSQDRREGNH
jgi:hypothetical protein